MMNQIVPLVCTALFKLIPSLDPHSANVPWGLLLPSLGMGLAGTFLYLDWEHGEVVAQAGIQEDDEEACAPPYEALENRVPNLENSQGRLPSASHGV